MRHNLDEMKAQGRVPMGMIMKKAYLVSREFLQYLHGPSADERVGRFVSAYR